MASAAASLTRVVTIGREKFLENIGNPDLSGALCGYTREHDTRAVLTLLCHAAPTRVLEIGTAFGHMTANLTRWTPRDGRIFSIGLVEGMARAAPGALKQQGDTPAQGQRGRFADQFGTAHKAFFIMGDSMTYDFGRLAPLELATGPDGHALRIARSPWFAVRGRIEAPRPKIDPTSAHFPAGCAWPTFTHGQLLPNEFEPDGQHARSARFLPSESRSPDAIALARVTGSSPD